ncbi:hypothetical protein BD410DRAFT_87173 [Rickenella mellea]|uniref:Uncharacterized protein n=1 Tax=Rickenella mellea TaxID=50990 RepID=A0A4Y7PKH5_9AGAM|nr:hypothetical protein BD410DRAFT_87173 [Rickenella mellea]
MEAREAWTPSVNDQRYLDPLHTFRRSLDDAMLCMEALVGTKSRLAKKIRGLKRRITPLVLERKIADMPDEILAHVFEAGHQASDGSEFALRMSHVCHRFRRISLRIPFMWNRLSSRQHIDQTRAFLSRSANQDLQIEIFVISRHMQLQVHSFLELTGPHSDQWSRLLYFTVPGVDDEVFHHGFTNFPRLQYISHRCDYPGRLPYTWEMPLLTQIDGFCSEFPKHTTFPFLSQLTCITLTFSSYDIFDLSSLFLAIFKAKHLQHLSLEFHNCQEEEEMLSPPSDVPTKSFHIQSLKVVLRDAMGDEFVISLHDYLAYFTASVVEFSLLTNGRPYAFLVDEYSFKFPRGSTTRLQIGSPRSLPTILQHLLKDGEIIRSLEFETSAFNDDATLSLNSIHYPSLRHIRFRNCNRFEEKHVGMLAKTFLTDNGNDNFQSLEIMSCSKISEDFILNLQDEVGEGLQWSV